MDLTTLNAEQRRAAETLDGPVLILAGAGSGKTRALTYRLANLIDHGVAAWEILALTFTNKAAREMKTRVEQLIGEEKAGEAWISTFHSTCARILRKDIEKLGYSRSFVIYDDDDQTRVLKEIYQQLNLDDQYIPIREARNKISDAKNRMLTPDEWFSKSSRDHRTSQVHDVMTLYEQRMKTLNALDFDDLLIKTLELFADHPPVLQAYRNRFRYVLVDEYQDTNTAQYELVRMITAESRNLCVVGDDDQSIYGWRGADIRNILDFEKDYPDATVIKLEQNYRSTANILDAANQVIAHNAERKDKKLWTESSAGDPVCIYEAQDEHDESAWIVQKIRELKRSGVAYGECAVLYRANAQSRIPEEMLMRSGIPYRMFGGQKFYERKEIKDILAYLRVIVNPADDISLARILNVPRRSIGESTVQALTEHARQSGMPLFSALGDLPDALGTRARNSVSSFFAMMTLLLAMKETMEPEEFVGELIERTGLEKQYMAENTDESRERLENIGEFRNALHEFVTSEESPTLESYLENVSLVTDMDRAASGDGYVNMMTLHSAKGLEFDHVFIPGMEENLFPSFRSVSEDNRLEEERRLMYVGITRARKDLYLTWARSRQTYGQYASNPPSRFLREIPDRLVHRESYRGVEEAEGSMRGPLGRGRVPSFGRSASASGGRWADQPDPFEERSPFSLPKRKERTGTAPKSGITLGGIPIDQIPGVRKGFVPSAARGGTESAIGKIFRQGDRVAHPKFGNGTVTRLEGSGAGARITVAFDRAGERVLALSVAPIVKLEEEP